MPVQETPHARNGVITQTALLHLFLKVPDATLLAERSMVMVRAVVILKITGFAMALSFIRLGCFVKRVRVAEALAQPEVEVRVAGCLPRFK